MTNMGCSPRIGVLMYVLVLARNALILQPWRPTISATCSELGTGTLSVMFWLLKAADADDDKGVQVDDEEEEEEEEDEEDEHDDEADILASLTHRERWPI